MRPTSRLSAALFAVGAMLSWATLAHALPIASVFSDCDGYGAPSGSGDGMTKIATRLAIFRPSADGGDTTRTTPTMGKVGIGACDAALADPALKPEFWLRKASLLRARAMHHMADNDVAAGMADLDLAEAAVVDPADPFYQRSLGWDIAMVRAYGLRKSGKQAEAESLVLKTWAKRPYNRESTAAAIVALGSDADPMAVRTVTRGMARLRPEAIDLLFGQAMRRRDFAEAILIYPQLVPPVKVGNEPMTAMEHAQLALFNKSSAELFWANSAGQLAIAYAEHGALASARSTLEAARTRLTTASTPPPQPPPNPDGKPDNGMWALEARYDKEIATLGTVVLETATRKVDALVSPPAAPGIPPPPPLLIPAPAASAEVTTLFKDLPDPESRDRVVGYDKLSVLWRGGDSFKVKDDGKGVTTVTFRGLKSSPSMAEELALLRAADLARTAGKTGLIVVGRRDIHHTLTTYMYGPALRTDYSGTETQLDVVFVDTNSLPPFYMNAPWRVIDAADVIATLSPIYGPGT